MLCSNLVERLQSFVIATLVLVSYAPNASTGSDEIAKNLIKPNKNASKDVPYTEYYIEHNVSQSDARRNFFESAIKLIDDKPMPTWCMECTDQINAYCLDGSLLDDHCCCESRHGTERIPWIPHSCYFGKQCTPTTGSCIKYTEIRECCCDRVLAKRWKVRYSNGMTTTVNAFTQLACVFLFITSWSLNWCL